jgi:hexokinase
LLAGQVALRYREPATGLGIILGTGTNCAYLEATAAIGKLATGYEPRGPAMVVNSEWADMSSPFLPTCLEDLWVDCSSAHPGDRQVAGGLRPARLALRASAKPQRPVATCCRHPAALSLVLGACRQRPA